MQRNIPRGNTLVEYGLIIGLVAIVAMSALMTLGRELGEKFQLIARNIHNVESPQAESTIPELESANPADQAGLRLVLVDSRQLVIRNFPMTPPAKGNMPASGSLSEEVQRTSVQLNVLAYTLWGEVMNREQAMTLVALSDQMALIAQIERPFEEVLSDSRNIPTLNSMNYRMNGKAYTLDALLELIRTAEANGAAGPEIEKLFRLLQRAEASGALNEPIVRQLVSRMVERVNQSAVSLRKKISPDLQTTPSDATTTQSVIGGNG